MGEPWLLVGDGDLGKGTAEVVLADEEARHASGALRCRPGDEVVLVDGNGSIARARLVACERSRAVAEVVQIENLSPPPPGVAIFLSVLHTKAMDWAVQKAVEVGAESVTPLVCSRTQLSGGAALGRAGHWGRVARQALKQCRRAWEMKVHDPVDVRHLVGDGSDPGVVADPDGVSALELPPAVCRRFVVGPEGGLTCEERRLFEDAGWSAVNLGPHVLRAETAAVVGAALLGMRLR